MRSRRLWAAASVALVMAAATACSGANADESGTAPGASSNSTQAPTPTPSEAVISASIPAGAKDVKINRSLRLNVTDGTLSKVSVKSKSGAISGEISADKATWQSTGRLQPGETYRIRGTAVDGAGTESKYRSSFKTQSLSLDQQTFPSFFPLSGSTVGVAMPVVVRFDIPVTDRKSIQKHLKVTSQPAQVGAFHWISNKEVHWRPKVYWKPGTKVTVNADIDSIPAGGGVYGQKSRESTFTVGRSMVSKVNMKTHTMKVYENCKLIKTMPITTGEQPKHTTRTGTKVIIEKFRKKRMNSETVGIPVDSDDGYDLDNVEFAMRLTYSGEFVHAAPWSAASQGRANVSHGCTGMSTADAGWLYNKTIIGDPMEFTGSDRPMTLSNGLGDWNLPFAEYAKGSSL